MPNIEINSILDGGVPYRERVLFKVNQADSLGFYLAILTTEISENLINKNPISSYWFPDQQVRAGDYILLYTGSAANSSFVNKLGTTTYNFYWGRNATLFNSKNDSILLMKADSWNYKKKGY